MNCYLSQISTSTMITTPLLSIFIFLISFHSSPLLTTRVSGNITSISSHTSNPQSNTVPTSLSMGSLLLLYAIGAQVLLVTNKNLKSSRWIEKGIKNATSAITNVVSTGDLGQFKSCMSLSAIRSSISSTSVTQLLSLSGGARVTSKEHTGKSIISNDLFVSQDDLSNLTLLDIENILLYMIEMNLPAFNRQTRLRSLRMSAQNVVVSMEMAICESIGSRTKFSNNIGNNPTSTTDKMQTPGAASMDALGLVAFVRLFAEWRSVRLVPTSGYASYAFGMGLAKRDLLQNVEKLENAVRMYISLQSNLDSSTTSMTPTLAQVLHFEIEQRKHPSLPRLTDNSAASGLLWIQRQIQYQTRIFNNVAMIESGNFKSSKDAALAAYRATYEPYHGFLLRQVFQRTVDASPEADILLQQMNIPNLISDEVRTTKLNAIDLDDVEEIHETWDYVNIEHSSFNSTNEFTEQGGDSMERVVATNLNFFETINGHILRMFTQCNGKSSEQPKQSNILDTTVRNKVRSKSVRIQSVQIEQSKQRSASEDISDYVATVQPILDQIDTLLDAFNMKDPSRI